MIDPNFPIENLEENIELIETGPVLGLIESGTWQVELRLGKSGQDPPPETLYHIYERGLRE